ncbi:MAG TPA: excinuclease ABC subunit UvrA [Gemmatimonadaceae bacterium]|nr:excinuclease ABC subunit UvrA [Gemmatimonadaceae bacterium]
MSDSIRVRGARQHNLKGIDVDIPHRAITVITGPSGSGKSSLAFDTIYAEGQRRYVESISAYARQFLERMPKPDVDRIEGLAPAVAIEQKNSTRTSRSTVGTATEIYDYLRLLWARVGHAVCPVCGRVLRPDSPGSAADAVLGTTGGARFVVAFPMRRSAAITHDVLVENLAAQGFVRVLADGRMLHLDDVATEKLDLVRVTELLVVVDRLEVDQDARGRLVDALETAFKEGDGDAVVVFGEQPVPGTPSPIPPVLRFTTRIECPNDGTRLPEPTPQLFSFNNPRGACETCNGFGAVLTYDIHLVVPDTARTLRDGAIHPWTMPRYDNKRRALAEFAAKERIPVDVPWSQLSAAQHDRLLNARTRGYKGIFPFLGDLEEKRYKQYIRVFLRRYQTAQTCETCKGARLKHEALQVRVGGRDIAAIADLSIRELRAWLDALDLVASERIIADHILREARDRVRFLDDVGLSYLSLNRAARTLSGGEAQRISLANALGSRLVDTLYVLDEPTIGLHARDVDRLLNHLRGLRESGNTVVMVEHDLAAIRAADHMVELGPGSGEHGGKLVFTGAASRVSESPLTGQYATGARTIPLPAERRRIGSRWLTLRGARAHTLRGVDIKIPLAAMTCVTGVSGSGKSTLVHDVLLRALERAITGEHGAREHLGEIVGEFDTLTGAESLGAAVLIDQEPIGRTPRSNPVTYVKAFDRIRELLAATPLARQRRFTASTFSFNVRGGRCETCEGAGYLQVEMQFLADVFVPCDVCGGARFKPGVLEVTYRGKNIVQLLELTIDEAIRFFPHEDKLGQALWHVQQVGLGYLRLGQPATTLSGGEAQRLKIARELAQTAKHSGRRLYMLDEPTTGLHLEDVRKLVGVLDRLVEHGHTLVVIEHNLDVIKLADWIIDMGPEGGDGGGRVVAMGKPEEIVTVAESHTGAALRAVLTGKAEQTKARRQNS